MTHYTPVKVPYTTGAVFPIHEFTPPSKIDATSGAKLISPHEIPSTPRQLKITGVIRAGPERNAQLVQCQVSPAVGHAANEVLVAKIWDPDYAMISEWGNGTPISEMLQESFNKEREAYKRIDAAQYPPPWQCTPRYYGSCSLQLPVYSSSSSGLSTRASRASRRADGRTVSVVLLEYVEGCSVLSLISYEKGGESYMLPCPRFSEDYCLHVWARFLEIISWLEHAGVKQNDLEKRNMMLSPAPAPLATEGCTSCPLVQLDKNRLPRTTLIDFDSADLEPARPDSKPQSPIDRWWSKDCWVPADWPPEWWETELPRRRAWLLIEFSENDYYAKPESGHDSEHLHSS